MDDEQEGDVPLDPDKGDKDSGAEEGLDELLGQMEAQSAGEEQAAQPEDYQPEDGVPTEQEMTQGDDAWAGMDQEGQPEAAGDDSWQDDQQQPQPSAVPSEPPDSLLEYMEESADPASPKAQEIGALPDSANQFLPQDDEENIPQWQAMFASSNSLNTMMRDMLIEHEQGISDQLRFLESSRF